MFPTVKCELMNTHWGWKRVYFLDVKDANEVLGLNDLVELADRQDIDVYLRRVNEEGQTEIAKVTKMCGVGIWRTAI